MVISVALTILVCSVIWLVLASMVYSIRIVLRPFSDRLVWLSVVIGTTITAIGGVGLQYSAYIFIIHVIGLRELPPVILLVFLLSPWLAFGITGPMMIAGQWIKHGIFDMLNLQPEREEYKAEAQEVTD